MAQRRVEEAVTQQQGQAAMAERRAEEAAMAQRQAVKALAEEEQLELVQLICPVK